MRTATPDAQPGRRRPAPAPARRDDGPARQEAAGPAYVRLRALIGDGLLAPGSPLVESDLSARLGVSRTPVRAALLRLQQEGFVTRVPGPAKRAPGGRAPGQGDRAIVSPLTRADLRETFLMAGALQAAAARLAAQLDPSRRERMAEDLAETNRALREAVERRPPDLVAAHESHARFHAACIDGVAGPRLRAEMDALAAHAARYERAYSVATLYAIDEFVSGHDAIVAAIRAGDADAAESSTATDWRAMADRHEEMVAVLGERGNW